MCSLGTDYLHFIDRTMNPKGYCFIESPALRKPTLFHIKIGISDTKRDLG